MQVGDIVWLNRDMSYVNGSPVDKRYGDGPYIVNGTMGTDMAISAICKPISSYHEYLDAGNFTVGQGSFKLDPFLTEVWKTKHGQV